MMLQTTAVGGAGSACGDYALFRINATPILVSTDILTICVLKAAVCYDPMHCCDIAAAEPVYDLSF